MADSDGNTDPDRAPVADRLRRWRRVDDLDGLRMRLQRALRTAEEVMLHPSTDDETRLSAARAVVSAAREARKAIEAHELERRLEDVEAALDARTPHRRN